MPDTAWLERLEDLAALFRPAFRRREQARWAAVYLQGLLLPGVRKTVGEMARSVSLPPDLAAEDAAQALQHFVAHSPWDEGRVWRRLRGLLAERGGGALVLDDLAVAKQGRHSVGVQRQFSGALGRKTNCQAAVAAYAVGPLGAAPVALRLYLPRNWAGDEARLVGAGVPEEHRYFRGKNELALDVVEELRREGWPLSAAVLNGTLAAGAHLPEALRRRGLDVTVEGDSTPPPALLEARRARQRLLEELGLDHFEGRSWRGFHHHACLAAVAFAFRLLAPHEEGGQSPPLRQGAFS
jgi:SRSO17 transposase